MTNVGGTIQEHDEHLHQIFDILIISGSYGGHRRHMTDDGERHGYGISSPQVS